jgi:DNA polymerase-3 subunit epsilon
MRKVAIRGDWREILRNGLAGLKACATYDLVRSTEELVERQKIEKQTPCAQGRESIMAMQERKRDQLTTASAFLPDLREQPPITRSRRNTLGGQLQRIPPVSLIRRIKSEYDRLDAPQRFRTCTVSCTGLSGGNQFRSWQMVLASPSEPLSQLEVLVVDCQATAAAPRGHLLEIGWARARKAITHAHSSLIALPDGEQIPPAVARITGISERMMTAAVDRHLAWRELSDQAASLAQQPAPTVIHFARFEQPFLRTLATDVFPLDVVCTRDIARRLLPNLPRCSLRALAGYFGRGVGSLRRSADHVEATAFVWHELVGLLDRHGVSTWGALHDWLAGPAEPIGRRRRIWPMPRDVRLSLPAAPGIYRMLRTDGSVLYVGKAASLHHRVNSYFRKQAGVPERLLEMLSQARAISFDVTPSALEAALLEPDEIKRHRPPYNVALTTASRSLWFTPLDLSARGRQPSPHCPFGPFASAETLDQFAALARAGRAALTPGSRGPDDRTFTAGYDRLCATHPELSRVDLSDYAKLLRLGTRLWREGRRDRDVDEDYANETRRSLTVWTPEFVQVSLEWLALRAALARRRAIWLTRLFESSVVWREPGDSRARLIVIENSEVVLSAAADAHATPPIPPGYRRPVAARREAFTLGSFDRLRVLTTELKRLIAAAAPMALRLDAGPALDEPRLASALWWV